MNKKIFKLLSLLFCFTFLALPCFAKNIQISLNGHNLKTNTAPVVENNTVFVPLRVISENLGAVVDFKPADKSITITTEKTNLKLYIGNKTATVNGSSVNLSAAPKVINQITLVPLRFVSEQLSCQVNWSPDTALISISSATVSNHPIATLVIKDYGTVQLELYPEMAPNTVNNFIALANKGFYNNLTFHRVIKDFMIQGGDPLGNGTGGPDYSIAGEFASNGYTQNSLSHTKGVISMARTMDPDSAGSQFFITSADSTFLDGQYAAFGKVTSGLDVIEKVSVEQTDSNDKPLKDIVIESISINLNGYITSAPVTTPSK